MGEILVGLLLIVGLINFLPVMGLFSPARMQAMYGVDLADPNLSILMRHRALMFGLLGGFIMVAAFNPLLQPAAFILGFVSMVGFMLIAWQAGPYSAGISKVVLADAIGTVLLIVAAGLYFFLRQDPR